VEKNLIGRSSYEKSPAPVSGHRPDVEAGLLFSLVLITVGVAPAQEADSKKFIVKPLPLPAANGLVMLDYFAYDRASRRLWVPAGNTGSVDVIDTTSDRIERVRGFPVAEVEFRGKVRQVGPSSVAIGQGVVYIGGRADSRICVIGSRTLNWATAPHLLHLRRDWRPRPMA
jgi:hypothetical protein